MQYKVHVGCSWQTNDMGVANHGTSQKEIPLESIVPGFDLLSVYQEVPSAKVVSFKDGCLTFLFSGSPVTVKPGHTWNSPVFGKPNPYIYEAEGYFVSVQIVYDKEDQKASAKRVPQILKEMGKNADEEGWPVWKNIPLARELFDILHNRLPINGEELDAAEIRYCCDVIFTRELLDQRDVPRLCLEFLQLRKIANEAITPECEHFDEVLGVIEADKIQNRLDFYIDPNVSMEWWVNYVDAHLLFDPIQRSPEWEEVIYDVELACEKRLKGVPRGMGFCHAYWPVKRDELAKRGIEWRTPLQMNPRVRFD